MSLRSLFRSRREDSVNSLTLNRVAGVSKPVREEKKATGDFRSVPASLHNDELPSTSPSKLTNGRDSDERLEALLLQVEEISAQQNERARSQALEIDELRRENASLKQRLKIAHHDVDDKHALSEYAKLITDAMPKVVDSSYVLKLQSQLCKAVHKMGILSNQVDVLQAQSEERIAALQERIVDQGNKSMRLERGHMNDLLEMECALAKLKEDHNSESKMQQGLIAELTMDLELERSSRCDVCSCSKRTQEKGKEIIASPRISSTKIASRDDMDASEGPTETQRKVHIEPVMGGGKGRSGEEGLPMAGTIGEDLQKDESRMTTKNIEQLKQIINEQRQAIAQLRLTKHPSHPSGDDNVESGKIVTLKEEKHTVTPQIHTPLHTPTRNYVSAKTA